ncbi:DUF1489 family protein [soil metagenome]
MALHLTKVAFGATSFEHLDTRLRERGEAGPVFLTTRYLPKRHEEIAGEGSLFWILKHMLVARSPILGFGEAEGGRVAILLGAPLVRVQPRPKRAHQGWRYLEAADAPLDLGDGAYDAEAMPAALSAKLSALALI